MRLSVIIPVLNEEKYIGKLLDALVRQTYEHFEVIVVDAGSTDATHHVVERFMHKLSLRFIVSPHRGVIHQRNFGARLAVTENLVFFDADALVKPDFLARLVRVQERENYDFLTSWNKPLTKNLFANLVALGVNIYMYLLRNTKPTANGPFMFVKKTAFNAVDGFSLECFPCEDRYLFERMHKAGFRYGLLREPPVYVSPRRADREGYFNYFLKIIYMAYLYHRYGLVKPEWVEYKM